MLARARAAKRRAELDEAYVAAFSEEIGKLYPGSPAAERRAIAEHACRKYSGRVGRSAAAKRFQADAIDLAVRAHIRHEHTKYDELLAGGLDRSEARETVWPRVEAVLESWRRTR